MYPKHLTRDLPSVEGKLISCLAKDISLFQEFPESITIDNFTSEENRIFFKVYKTLYEKKYSTIDEVSINSEFPQGSKDRQLFESYHGSAMTKEFKNNELSAIENFDKFKGDFLEVNSKMALYKELKSSIDRFNIEEFCNETTEHIYSYIDHKLTNSVISVNSEADIENLGIDDEFIERCKKGEAVGITYGLHEYNKATMGMHFGNLSLLAYGTNVGKTNTMFSNFVLDYAMQGEEVFIYSNETDKYDFQTFLLVNVLSKKYGIHKITKNKLKNGKLTEEQWEQIKVAQDFINENIKPLITVKYPKSHNMKEFVSYVRRYAYRGVKYFFMDTMKSDEAGSAQSVGLLVDQSRTIYETCKKLNVHCLATAQIALRHIENFTRVITEAHLAGSKQISEVCDVIITGRDLYLDELDGEKNEIKIYKNVTDDNGKTWRKEYQKMDRERSYVLLNLPKNRYGEKGIFTVFERLGHLGQFHQIGLAKLKAI